MKGREFPSQAQSQNATARKKAREQRKGNPNQETPFLCFFSYILANVSGMGF